MKKFEKDWKSSKKFEIVRKSSKKFDKFEQEENKGVVQCTTGKQGLKKKGKKKCDVTLPLMMLRRRKKKINYEVPLLDSEALRAAL